MVLTHQLSSHGHWKEISSYNFLSPNFQMHVWKYGPLLTVLIFNATLNTYSFLRKSTKTGWKVFCLLGYSGSQYVREHTQTWVIIMGYNKKNLKRHLVQLINLR